MTDLSSVSSRIISYASLHQSLEEKEVNKEIGRFFPFFGMTF